MSLKELAAEYERQLAAPLLRFDRPLVLLKHIMEKKPPKEQRVTIDMCVMHVEEHNLCWHVDMIAKSPKNDYKQRKEIVMKLTDEGRAKFVFCLSLWKSKKQSRDHVTGDDYVEGRSYVVNNVNGLHFYLGISQGSVQARSMVKSELDEPRNRSKRKLKEPKEQTGSKETSDVTP